MKKCKVHRKKYYRKKCKILPKKRKESGRIRRDLAGSLAQKNGQFFPNCILILNGAFIASIIKNGEMTRDTQKVGGFCFFWS